MVSATPTPWNFKPGIQRDGTRLDKDACQDGQWTRFQRGRPRKIGGYKRIIGELLNPSRELHEYASGNNVYYHVGESDNLEAFYLDPAGNPSGLYDRTPSGFVTSPYNDWQFDASFDTGGDAVLLIGHAAQNLLNIASTDDQPYYTGDITDDAALTEVSGSDVSGGVVVLNPFTFRYGNAGYVAWSDANQPTVLSGGVSGDARIAATKVVKGLPLRGTTSGPAGLFWCLDQLVRASFTTSAAVWQFDTLSSDVSVLSANSIVELDGIYYWVGMDRFQMYNGVVREIPNDMNFNFFFDNLNLQQRSKVFAHKVPRYGEIWWCFPRGSATECNHAVILNVREGSWCDTPLPDDFRTCSAYAQMYPYPIMGSFTVDADTNGYAIWQHEFGTDKVFGTSSFAIKSYFQTNDMTLTMTPDGTGPGNNKNISVAFVEPDFVQSGDLTLTVLQRGNARSPVMTSDPNIITPQTDAGVPTSEQLVPLKQDARQIAYRVESNVAGGNYQMGVVMHHISPSEGRLTQGPGPT